MEEFLNEEEKSQGPDNRFIYLENVHKTYLLGIEGVAALRFALLFIYLSLICIYLAELI